MAVGVYDGVGADLDGGYAALEAGPFHALVGVLEVDVEVVPELFAGALIVNWGAHLLDVEDGRVLALGGEVGLVEIDLALPESPEGPHVLVDHGAVRV